MINSPDKETLESIFRLLDNQDFQKFENWLERELKHINVETHYIKEDVILRRSQGVALTLMAIISTRKAAINLANSR